MAPYIFLSVSSDLFSKIIKDKSCNRTIISDEDMQLIMKII